MVFFSKKIPSTGSGNGGGGFFMGRLRERFIYVLAKKYKAMDGGFAHAESHSDSALLRKIHGGIFRRRPTRDWRGGGSRSVGMEGVGAPGTPESP